MRNTIKKLIPKRIKKLSRDEDINYIIKYSRYDVTIQILIFAFGFFNTWFLANFLSFELYGTYLLILSVTNFFGFFSFTGIHQSLIQTTSRGYDYFLLTSTRKLFIYTQLGTIAITTYTIIYSIFFDFNVIFLICSIISGLFFPSSVVILLYQNFLFGKEEYKKRFKIKLLTVIMNNCLLFLFGFFLQNLILFFLLLNGYQIILNYYFFRSSRKFIKKEEKDRELDRKATKYGMMLTTYGVIPLIAANINNIIISMYFGSVSLAFYTIGISITSKLKVLTKPSLSTLMTKYSKEKSTLSKTFIIYLVIFSIILCFGIQLILPLFLQILFPLYVNSVSYGILHAFLIIFYPITIVYGYYFRAKSEEKVIKIALTVPNLISLALIIPFLILWGIYGLILSEILIFVIKLGIFLLYSKKVEWS